MRDDSAARTVEALMTGSRGKAAVAAALVAAVLGVGALAGCRASPAASSATSTPASPTLGRVTVAPDGVQDVTIQTQDNYVFTPDHFSVKPGTIRLTVVNVGTQISHSFRFTPGKGPEPIPQQILLLTAGQKQTIQFTVTRPGTYQFECAFHVDLGQVGTMTVGG
jgi:plastocyanin